MRATSSTSFLKRPVFYIPAALLLLLCIGVTVLLWPNGQTPARIHMMTGEVSVDSGSGFTPANEGMALHQDDVIRTGDGATAMIVLYEGILVRLAPLTEVSITELSAKENIVTQHSGTVWSKIAHIGGIEKYDIKTPTTTATVRGTSLRTSDGANDGAIDGENETVFYTLLVAEGKVMASGSDGSTVDVTAGEKIILVDGAYAKQPLTPEDIAAIKEQLGIELRTLRELRLREVYKNDVFVALAKSRYDVTDDDIAEYFIGIDDGRNSEQELRDNAPDVPNAARIYEYNAAIRIVLEAMMIYP